MSSNASNSRAAGEKRLAANRANAQKSTGPRTPEGKQRAAFNSFQHGAFAEKDAIRAQALAQTHAGAGGEGIEARRRLLEADWRPASAQQSLLVGDLAWLYWARDQAAAALVEADSRRRARAQIDRDLRRFNARHRESAVRRIDLSQAGCVCAADSESKFIEAAKMLDALDRAAYAGQWTSKDRFTAPNALEDLYGTHEPTVRGAQVIELWYACLKEKAKAGDERAGQIRALLEEERAALAEEEAIFRRLQELDIEQGDDDAQNPLGPLGEAWQRAVGAIERLDRQINAKIRLLLRLQRDQAAASEGSAEGAGGAGRAALAMSADPLSQTSQNDAGAAQDASREDQARPKRAQIAGTNPSEAVESTTSTEEAFRRLRQMAFGDAAGAPQDAQNAANHRDE